MWVFSLRRNVAIFPTHLTLTGNKFKRVGAATEKALVPTFSLTLATKSRLELDDRSCLGSLAGASSDCKYAGCLDVSVYKPVSLTLVIKDHILDFLVRHKLLNPSQHGFLKARSYLTNMLCFLEETTKWLDEGSPVDIIYLDSQKLFEKVPHQRILLKLKAHGIVMTLSTGQNNG